MGILRRWRGEVGATSKKSSLDRLCCILTERKSLGKKRLVSRKVFGTHPAASGDLARNGRDGGKGTKCLVVSGCWFRDGGLN